SFVARVRQTLGSFGCFCALCCSEESDEEPLLELEKKFCIRSVMPVEPEPTPKKMNPAPKATARRTNIHFACTRSRLKKSCSSQPGCFGFARFGGAAGWVTALGVGRGRRLRCCVPRAMRPLLAGSG